jgi:hypothetical protein
MIRKGQARGSAGLLHYFILGLFAATNQNADHLPEFSARLQSCNTSLFFLLSVGAFVDFWRQKRGIARDITFQVVNRRRLCEMNCVYQLADRSRTAPLCIQKGENR